MKVGLLLLLFACLSINALSAQEKRDSFDLAEEFNHYYYDFFVHVNQHIDVVTIKPLTHELIWETSAGPKVHKGNLLKKQFDAMGVIDSEKVDSASFSMDKEDKLRDYLYQHFLLNNRLATISFDGKTHKVVVYELVRLK